MNTTTEKNIEKEGLDHEKNKKVEREVFRKKYITELLSGNFKIKVQFIFLSIAFHSRENEKGEII